MIFPLEKGVEDVVVTSPFVRSNVTAGNRCGMVGTIPLTPSKGYRSLERERGVSLTQGQRAHGVLRYHRPAGYARHLRALRHRVQPMTLPAQRRAGSRR